jgi:hypothetical protein
LTRRGIERERFLAFVSMTRSGASNDEAIAYLDLIWPFDLDLVKR